MFRHVIQIRNDYSELERAIGQISMQLKERGAAAELISAVNLGLEEVITNILKYGYDDRSEHRIDIRLLWNNEEFSIEVEDDGHEFNPLNQPEPIADQSLEERQPGGLGIPFLRKVFDSLNYERKANKNVLALRKRTDSGVSTL